MFDLGMVRHTNMKMTVVKVPRNRRHKGHAGSHGEAAGLVGRQREWGENMGENLYYGFPGKNGRGRVNRPKTAGVNNLSRLWGVGTVLVI